MTTGNMSLVHRLRHTKLYSDIIPLSQKSCIRIVFVKTRLLSCKPSLSHCVRRLRGELSQLLKCRRFGVFLAPRVKITREGSL